ncbi:hypothetical protein LZ012_10575 [Dechloromonas sp. XY25]|uniref:Transmembrane protein n=1 Tax=Dechloromonas hankyongensis TaxID=2908002 RepID=A0ABS9K2M7_9RHOO|nr:hypothetical protein [Dechloromonas hankyongensis]MCG2577437.1 hypothetical protein [Dechloromonas hankyongensis]
MNTAAHPVPPAPPTGQLRLLVLVVALFALPFSVAGGLFYGGWQPERTANRGFLVVPPVALPLAELQPVVDPQGRWLLVLAGGRDCAADCLRHVDELRRVQVSLYKEMNRVRRLVLVDNEPSAELTALARQQLDLLIARKPASWARIDAIHVLDPQGRLVLDYTVEAPPRDIRSDLERLLKAGRNG